MPAYSIGVGDIVECTNWQTYQGQTVLNVLHYRVSVGGNIDGPATLQALATALSGGLGPFGVQRNVQVNTLVQDRITVQKVWPTRWAPESLPQNIAGAIAGTDSPVNTAPPTDRKVAQAGRGFQGRLHLPGWDYAGFTNGRFVTQLGQVAAYAVLLANLLSDQLAAGFGTTFKPCLVNLRKVPVTQRDVVGISFEKTVRTMHRRTVGLGI